MSSETGGGFAFSQKAFTDISTIYEEVLASHYEHVKTILSRITSTFLKPQSSILDIGSGTGKPIAAHFADNRHIVTGIDHSPGMINRARSQVPNATFIQVEMTSWEPAELHSYDMVIASHALYNFSVAQIRTMIYKFATWVKKGGLVVIGASYNPGISNNRGIEFDQRGWAEGYTDTFLGYSFIDRTYGREDAWINLIKETGLEIVDVDRSICLRENDPNPDTQFYIITRAVQDNHLIGPFPVPDSFSGAVDAQTDAWAAMKEGLEVDEINQAAFEALRKGPSCRKVLYVAKSPTAFQIPGAPGIEFLYNSELPSPDVLTGSLDGVLFAWILHAIPSPGQYIDDAIKAVSSTSNARFVVIQPAPDNELIRMYNAASQDLGLPLQHHGYLLKEAESKLRAAGFQTINYIRKRGSINFGPAQDGRLETAAGSLSKLYTADKEIQAQLQERFKKLLNVHFLFKSSGEIACPMIILVAEQS